MYMMSKKHFKTKKQYSSPTLKIVNVRSQVPLIAYSGTFGFKDSEKEYFA